MKGKRACSRIREIDACKRMSVYMDYELRSLRKSSLGSLGGNRTAQLTDDMDKDEEGEHHLQRALRSLRSSEYTIPTPTVQTMEAKLYDRVYRIDFHKPKAYIRTPDPSKSTTGKEIEYPDYDADHEDELWLRDKRKQLPKDFNEDLTLYFECIMDRLEKIASHSMNLTALKRAKYILTNELNSRENQQSNICFKLSQKNRTKYVKEHEEFLNATYNYWTSKRLKYKHPLTPMILNDKSLALTSPNNPFLVFTERSGKPGGSYSSSHNAASAANAGNSTFYNGTLRKLELKRRCLNK